MNNVNEASINQRIDQIRNGLLYIILTEDSSNIFLNVPSNFWDPVIVKLPDGKVDDFDSIHIKDECLICTSEFDIFKKLPCCKNSICVNCTNKWFELSVKCPFCKTDIRSC